MNERNISAINAKLRRLWKGTLYVGIVGAYIGILGLHFFRKGWESATVILFFIALVQLFRYISDDVDRLGWVMRDEKLSDEQRKVTNYQKRMYLLLFSLMQLANIAIIFGTTFISVKSTIAVGVGLLIVEVIFRQIRNVNRSIDYERASYGIKDASPVFNGPDHQYAMITDQEEPEEKIESYEERSDKKIAKLKEMVDKGFLSQIAFEEARDKEVVERIMNEY